MKLFSRPESGSSPDSPSIQELRRRLLRSEPAPVPPPVVGPSPLRFSDSRRADDAVPFSLRVAAGISWRLLVLAAAIWGLFKIFAATSTVVIPIGVAILLTALLMPLVVLLNHKLHFPRHLAALVALVGGIVLVVGLITLAGGQIVSGVSQLGQSVEQGLNQIQYWLANGPLKIGGDQLNDMIGQGRQWVSDNSGSLTSGVLSAGTTAGTMAAGAIIALFVTFFFLAEGDQIWSWLVSLLPREVRTPVHEGFRRGWVSLGSYVKTQALVAAVDAVLISAGAFALGLPLVLPLGLIIFFASAVPIVGAVVSGALAVILALVVKGVVPALIMMGVVIAVQQLEGNVLQPVLMSKAVALHPLATLLGVAVGSYLMGIVGALFAVPVMAVANTVTLYLTGHDKFPMLAENASALTNSPKELAGENALDDELKKETAELESMPKKVGEVDPDYVARQAAERASMTEEVRTQADFHEGRARTKGD
ncbi:AI-2E family transporter [Gephyromycinifex aptenodytis]|uniref:AI-2E family transporter n=1 Tax=Gephyromycinifex aptenodytis TaxID=2716227 RepID=UPI001445EF0C|nr:AI-2E family transporter [Gephyromycinifex aptenodytis]